MICKECGGRIQFNNGKCICDSCGREELLNLPYEKLDVFICDSASDEIAILDKETQMVQQVKTAVQSIGVNTYVQKKVVDDTSIADILNVVSANKAQVLVFVCASKESLARIYDRYSPVINGKTIITLYSGVSPRDFPDELKKYQALNFDSIGSMKDLQKGIGDTLGIKPSEVDVSKLYKPKNKRIIILSSLLFVCIAVLVIGVVRSVKKPKESIVSTSETSLDSSADSESSENTEPSEMSDEELFAYAQQLAADGNYADAIDMFESIHDYAHSVDELSLLFLKYAGYYYDEEGEISFHLNKTGPESATVDVRLSSGDAVVFLSEDFVFTGTTNSVQFTDSMGNSGSVDIELRNDEIVYTINTSETSSDLSFGNETYTFSLSERSDTPRTEEITLNTIKNWLSQGYTLTDFANAGFNLIPSYYYDGPAADHWNTHSILGLATCYKIENTEIYLVFFDFDCVYGTYYGDSAGLEEPQLYAVGVNYRFLSNYDSDLTNPFEHDANGFVTVVGEPFDIEGLYVIPGLCPDVLLGNGEFTVERYLIVDESFASEEFRGYVEQDVFGMSAQDESEQDYPVCYYEWDGADLGVFTNVGSIALYIYPDPGAQRIPDTIYYEYYYNGQLIYTSDITTWTDQNDQRFIYAYCGTSNISGDYINEQGYLIPGEYRCVLYDATGNALVDSGCTVVYESIDYEENTEPTYSPLTSGFVDHTEWFCSDNDIYTNVSDIELDIIPTSDATSIQWLFYYEYYLNGQLIYMSDNCTDQGSFIEVFGGSFYFDGSYINDQGYLVPGEYRCVVYSMDGNVLADSTCTVVCE